MDKEQITTSEAPEPRSGAPYSQAVAFGPLVFASGQLPIDPATGELVRGGITEQTEQVLKNLSAVLTASGSGMRHLVKTTVFLQNAKDWPAMNEVYARYVGPVPPARSAVPVPELSMGALVEIEAIAVRTVSDAPEATDPGSELG
jgi:2-iminobutanoate/2-iminopropanoate deaminase